MTYNKEFEYRGYQMNIKIEKDTKIEKRIDGNRWHTITTNCMGYDNYYQKDEVLDNALEVYLFNAENKAKEYIDKKLDNTTDDFTKRLNSLGFK